MTAKIYTIADSMNKVYDHLNRFRYVYAFFVLAGIIIVYAWYYYRTELHRIKFEKYDELSAIAKLKVDQISRWRSERLHNANIISKNPIFISAVDKFLTKDKSSGDLLKTLIKLEVNEHEFISAALLDSNLKPVLTDSNFELINIIPIAEVIKKKSPFLSDIFTSIDSANYFIDVYIPFYHRSGKAIGLMILRGDANISLFPLIQSWPTPSQTSELLLCRKEGNYVVYINNLRHGNIKPFSLKLPVSNIDLPASKLARGITGVVEGIDYRGVPVLADLRKVPDSEWLAVTKVDKDEIYAPLYERLTIIILFSTASLIILASLLAYIWRTRRAKYFSEINENLERISDIFLGFDKNLNFTYLNKHALKIGYSQGDIGRNLFETYPAFKKHILGEKFLEAMETQNNLTFESLGVLAPADWFRMSLYPSPEGLSVFAKNITAEKNIQLRIQEVQNKIRDVYERVGDMVFGYDKEWNLIYKNKAADDAGYNFLKIHKSIGENLSDKDTELESWFNKVFKTQKVTEFEYEISHGTIKKYLHFTLYPSEEGLTVFAKDLTAFHKTQIELEKATKKNAEIIESINDPFFSLDRNWHIVYANQPAYKALNLTDDIIGKMTLWEHLPKFKGSPVEHNFRLTMQTNQKIVFEQKGIYDTDRIYSIHVYPSETGITVLLRDITAEKETKYLLTKAVEEKQMLMREAHHRVKNSLQLVISILNLQLNSISNEGRKHLADAISRVNSIATLHSKLYQGENFNEVNLKEYITDLVQSFKDSFKKDNFEIMLDVDDFCLRTQDAAWIGIILNELVSNSFKYAFSEKNNGEIKVSLKKNVNFVYLTVHDNGIGFMNDRVKKNSLGFLLLNNLTEELNGDLKMENRKGAFTQLKFPIR